MKQIRCAIYTRKSSEEGLEQDFNSLDAQREACAAYVLSQASEGWSLLPELYDDGGISGGTLERPALQRLLSDVKEGRIDIIVVYKVDRLTRSLLDFAKLVEAFDEGEVSFVSITQSFNTTTSMGRLTLNMLLSFAQFEREVTAERIRDKIAASKAKGMWMGGTPPLGYEPNGKNSLTIIEEHADIIRDIYARYRTLRNVRHVAEALERDGIKAPLRQRQNGKALGGCVFARGQLYHILRSPIYAGDIPHKDKVYPGNHPAIISREEWDAVQELLTDNARGVRTVREASKALLAGILFDAQGEALIPVHTSKPAGTSAASARIRYRYYVSKSAHHEAGEQGQQAMRIPAREIEQAVMRGLVEPLRNPVRLASQMGIDLAPDSFANFAAHLEDLREAITKRQNRIARSLLENVIIRPDRLELVLSAKAIADRLNVPLEQVVLKPITHVAYIRLTRTGLALRLVDQSGVLAGEQSVNPTLTRLLAQGHSWWKELSTGTIDIASLSRREEVSASWATRVVRLAFLAPDITEAILRGTAPAHLDTKSLLASNAIASSWDEQRRRLFRAGK